MEPRTADKASDAIVQAMVDLARAMRVDVTAEGVETAAQRDFLQSIGCNELQGFLLSRPLKPEQVDGFSARHRPSSGAGRRQRRLTLPAGKKSRECLPQFVVA